MREISVSPQGELLINQTPVILKGVNHHDTHPTEGYTVSEAFLRDELLKMKALNINCIRTSHYPPTPEFLNLCDELGFYVVDEADLELHGFEMREGSQTKLSYIPEGTPVCDPQWLPLYTELFHAYPNAIGGCIWEWADHTVLENGVPRYGGDFGEPMHDGNFCCDGLTFYDRGFKAGSYHAKYVYQPMRAFLEDGRLRIRNDFDFTDLSECRLELSLAVDGEERERLELSPAVKPHEETVLSLPFSVPSICRWGAFVNLRLKNSRDEEIGLCQLPLSVPVAPVQTSAPLSLREEERYVWAEGTDFAYRFDKRLGTLDSLVQKGKEELASPLRLTTWRAPTDNDRHVRGEWGMSENGNNWCAGCFDLTSTKLYAVRVEGNCIVTEASLGATARTPYFRFTQEMAFFADGTVKVSLRGRKKNSLAFLYLPRLGYEFSSPVKNDGFSYFGMGPGKSYCDMHLHAPVGLYHSTAEAEYVPHIRPQEHGNHCGCRFLQMERGLTVETDTAFECCVSAYPTAALDRARHIDELESNGKTNIRIDYKVSGIGSNSCGPRLEERYQLNEMEIAFAFYLKMTK